MAERCLSLWNNTYETTPIVMRSFAEQLNVSTFPDCVFHHGAYWDCIHHYLLPSLFVRPVWRASQAYHFPPQHLNVSLPPVNLCQCHKRRSLNACHGVDEVQSYMPKDRPKCTAIGDVPSQLSNRLVKFHAAHAALTLDMLVMESQKDPQVSPSSRRKAHLTTIFRARKCRGDECETVHVREYRYQAALSTSDFITWFPVVA
ncbi:TPA: hypothetical protein N0F65_009393 [Lagenidium giganteum]|uniref:Uncharacterized protein n=1 Tax=Lagenidium giganteum TaxID=4803 RepID=A0AAV2Z9E4_9STRA|nr:TPA: hypothetical protein N0F65_009393 [Lagenidium giganteum]